MSERSDTMQVREGHDLKKGDGAGREPVVRREAAADPAVRFVPRVDIYETSNELVVEADMPGVTPENLAVEFDQGTLTLTGRVANRLPEKGRLLAEYSVGDYHRAFQIDMPVDTSAISAELKNGVLYVRLPKTQEARARKIPVRAG
jgi:HSP20 family protein